MTEYQSVISTDISVEGFAVILHLSEKDADRIINQNRQKPRRP
jgi:plasmid maintenance system antidote protein VapI